MKNVIMTFQEKRFQLTSVAHLEFRACSFIDQGLLPVKRNWIFPPWPGTVGHETALKDVLYFPKPGIYRSNPAAKQ